MKSRKQIEQRIEALLDEANRARAEAQAVSVTGSSSFVHKMSLEKLEYAGLVAATHLKWILEDEE